jgi:hypothetical protein
MMNVELLRLTSQKLPYTHGVLLFNGTPELATHELPWKGNQKQISCIPEGIYFCKRVNNRRTLGGLFIPTTFLVDEVPDRSGILFHVGNWNKDTNGCILPGVSWSFGNNEAMVSDSSRGFSKFLRLLDGINAFTLDVKRLASDSDLSKVN